MDTTITVEANKGWSPAPVNTISLQIHQDRIPEGLHAGGGVKSVGGKLSLAAGRGVGESRLFSRSVRTDHRDIYRPPDRSVYGT